MKEVSLLPITIELFSFFVFRQLHLYKSDSLHLFTLFLTDSLKKCQTKSFENEYSTFTNYFANFDSVVKPHRNVEKRTIIDFPCTVFAKKERFSAMVNHCDRIVVNVDMLLDKKNGIGRQLF